MENKKETGNNEKKIMRAGFIPAAAVFAAVLIGLSQGKGSEDVDAMQSQEVIQASALKEYLSDPQTVSDGADSGKNTGKSAASSKKGKESAKKTSKIKTGTVKTPTARSNAPAAQGGAASAPSHVSVPENGYRDGVYEGSGKGFGGTIRVRVTVSGGKITGIDILEASGETPSYFAAAKGVISQMLASGTPNADAVSGATFSSNGIIQAVQNALAGAGMQTPQVTAVPTPQPTSVPEKEDESGKTEGNNQETSSKYKDGTYKGEGTGFNGPVILTGKIKNGKLQSLKADHIDTPSFFERAWTDLKDKILNAQSTEGIDTVSGATYSSRGILDAAAQIFAQAKDENGTKPTPKPTSIPQKTPTPTPQKTPTPIPEETPAPEGTPTPTPEIEGSEDMEITPMPDQEETQTPDPTPTPEPAGKYRDGTYTGSGWGFSGKVQVTVTISGGQIVSLVPSHSDTEDYFRDAWKKISSQILAVQGADGIDTVSGATYSSEGILSAVQAALSQAL